MALSVAGSSAAVPPSPSPGADAAPAPTPLTNPALATVHRQRDALQVPAEGDPEQGLAGQSKQGLRPPSQGTAELKSLRSQHFQHAATDRQKALWRRKKDQERVQGPASSASASAPPAAGASATSGYAFKDGFGPSATKTRTFMSGLAARHPSAPATSSSAAAEPTKKKRRRRLVQCKMVADLAELVKAQTTILVAAAEAAKAKNEGVDAEATAEPSRPFMVGSSITSVLGLVRSDPISAAGTDADADEEDTDLARLFVTRSDDKVTRAEFVTGIKSAGVLLSRRQAGVLFRRLTDLIIRTSVSTATASSGQPKPGVGTNPEGDAGVDDRASPVNTTTSTGGAARSKAAAGKLPSFRRSSLLKGKGNKGKSALARERRRARKRASLKLMDQSTRQAAEAAAAAKAAKAAAEAAEAAAVASIDWGQCHVGLLRWDSVWEKEKAAPKKQKNTGESATWKIDGDAVMGHEDLAFPQRGKGGVQEEESGAAAVHVGGSALSHAAASSAGAEYVIQSGAQKLAKLSTGSGIALAPQAEEKAKAKQKEAFAGYLGQVAEQSVRDWSKLQDIRAKVRGPVVERWRRDRDLKAALKDGRAMKRRNASSVLGRLFKKYEKDKAGQTEAYEGFKMRRACAKAWHSAARETKVQLKAAASQRDLRIQSEQKHQRLLQNWEDFNVHRSLAGLNFVGVMAATGIDPYAASRGRHGARGGVHRHRRCTMPHQRFALPRLPGSSSSSSSNNNNNNSAEADAEAEAEANAIRACAGQSDKEKKSGAAAKALVALAKSAGQATGRHYRVRMHELDRNDYATPHASNELLRAAAAGDIRTFVAKKLGHSYSGNSVDERGRGALSLAAAAGHADFVRCLLVDAKTRGDTLAVEQRDRLGRTALALAAEHGHVAVLEILIQDCGAMLEATDRLGWTPLIAAGVNAQVGTLKALVAAGANPTAADAEGQTAYDWAARAYQCQTAPRVDCEAAMGLLTRAQADANKRAIEKHRKAHDGRVVMHGSTRELFRPGEAPGNTAAQAHKEAIPTGFFGGNTDAAEERDDAGISNPSGPSAAVRSSAAASAARRRLIGHGAAKKTGAPGSFLARMQASGEKLAVLLDDRNRRIATERAKEDVKRLLIEEREAYNFTASAILDWTNARPLR